MDARAHRRCDDANTICTHTPAAHTGTTLIVLVSGCILFSLVIIALHAVRCVMLDCVHSADLALYHR